ncbi:aromatic ring-hydroxylating oxygenase subunit alpha [Biformimicrobium ophioploci]|uniref:Ring-hydroxylating oxygenase subunit alpha n=1 Tax=Biformimicrobium ophioploci TaxID=3036711 RepID=A0ABQ6M1Y1_9GAMM|nr:aromatic ring-hydroxylating dioxygenase subunit alpha [Microbulbifer sp. NKW57]GMG88360.1 ring-hydroxylating oxygenase subunit alpha [Microbulbifer sp. NKW57]
MQHEGLVREIKTLLDLVERKATTLADSVMEIDVREYTNPEQFEKEKIELFRNYPQFVGPSCLLPNPGDYYAFDDTGVPILIVRAADGSLNAFVNICSHRGAPLTECASGQAKRGKMFSCPYHGWSYNLDGELVGIPFGKEGFPDIDRSKLGLKTLQVEEKYGMIFVMPNPELRFDIDEVLGGIQERMSGFGFEDHHYLGVKQVYTDFSWKLNMDTFHEFYHFDFLHPESIGAMAYGNTANYVQYGRNHSMSSATLQINDLKDIPEEQWLPREYSSYVNYIFPNTVIFVVNDHFQTWRVYPISTDKSVVYHSMFIPKKPANEEEQKAFEDYFQMINDVAVAEDYGLVDKVHRGLQAGIERKVIIGRNEPGVQNMHRTLNEVLA